MKYRSKKVPSESIVIHDKHWKGPAEIFHPTFFGREPIRASEPLPDKLSYDCRLQKTHLGEFYLCLLMPLDVRRGDRGVDENQVPLAIATK